MRVEQRFATSKDGTRVPYFVVWPQGLRADGSHPTLLYGYGGFESRCSPGTPPAWGRPGAAQGGVLVVANIRGGGEFGPAWHQAAIKAPTSSAATTTSPPWPRPDRPWRHHAPAPGHQGGSNGGLLVGAVMLQRPELFGAVVCQVPLLDMRRYHRLLAGASWMAEYGNPDLPENGPGSQATAPTRTCARHEAAEACCSPPAPATTACTPATPARWPRRMLSTGPHAALLREHRGRPRRRGRQQQRADMLALEFAFLWQEDYMHKHPETLDLLVE
jgi:prolyl oligopeptidase